MGHGLKCIADLDKSQFVNVQTGLCGPRLGPGHGHPQYLVQLKGCAVGALQSAGPDFNHLVSRMDVNVPLGKNASKFGAHKSIMRDKDVIGIGKQVKFRTDIIRPFSGQ